MNSTRVMTGSNAVDEVADRADRAVDGATAMPTAEWVGDSGKAIATRCTDLAVTCSGYVRSRPLISMAGAQTIGYLAGRMLR